MVLKRVALTGASGMVGRHCLQAFHDRKISCIATSRSRPSVLPMGCTWGAWDLRDWNANDAFDELFGSVDAVFHVGAYVPNDMSLAPSKDLFDSNSRGSLNIGIWASEHQVPLIYLSTSTVYRDPLRKGILEDDPKRSGNGLDGFYGTTKLIGERVLHSLGERGAHVCILRPSSIYGTGLPANKMIPKWLRSAGLGETIALEPPVDDAINLIHATDVAEAMIAAAEREARGVFNIASRYLETLESVARTCVTVAGKGSVLVSDRPSDRPKSVRFGLDCTRAQAEFAFQPRIDLSSGIQRMWKERI